MKIIISPAKKMNVREDELDWADLPCFLSRAEELKEYIRGLNLEEARRLWQCNEKLAALNYGRFQDMDLKRRLTPALLSYEGIQYQYMAPGVFERRQWDYAERNLRILSGFYGVLKPLDGIVPYRLEMQAKVELPSGVRSLYDYWGRSIYEEIVREERMAQRGEAGRNSGESEAAGGNPAAGEIVIVNLASKEYSRAVEPYLEPHVIYVSCVFGSSETDRNGNTRVKVKATGAKMARGEMVRFMARRQAEDTQELKDFKGLGYRYSPTLSSEREYVFLKGGKEV